MSENLRCCGFVKERARLDDRSLVCYNWLNLTVAGNGLKALFHKIIMRYKTILLFGAPGSGKGTQGQILGSIPGMVHVSTGELFRDLRVSSPLAKKFLDYSSRGALVPDDFTVDLWHEHVEGLIGLHRYEPKTDILILDGIPRTVAQARLVDKSVDVLRVYYLDCEDKDIMYMRLKRRALHENRLDDASDAVIQNRLYVYEAETAPVLNYYSSDIVRHIDTGRTPVEVLADILADIKTIIAPAVGIGHDKE